ncbi:MAG: membrane protein insertion efficiency factor YidD [Clostridia bacterium]|nr:membrane protein insertion efficiency factor YidD [Clostridia bacterium]
MKSILTVFIKFYRACLTHVLKSNCIFTPTCSAYALEALKKRNVFVAIGLIIWRILRCNPFSVGGYDPVPDSRRQKKFLM